MRILVILGLVLGLSSLWDGPVLAGDNTVSAEEVKKEAREALDASKAYSAQQSAELQKKLTAELDRIQHEIDRLTVKLNQVKKESRDEVDKQVKELQAKKDAAAKSLRDMQASTGKAWEDMRSGMRSAIDDLNKAYDRAVSRFR